MGKREVTGAALRRAVRNGRRRVRRKLGREPSVPAGWDTDGPSFVGVGAQRAGTTWWFGLLRDHPQIHAPAKELHFFDRYATGDFGDTDAEHYRRALAHPPGLASGEWTPRYMHDFWVPPLLRRAAPDAKLLVLLRDPLERLRSGLAHEHRVLRRELRSPRGAYLAALVVDDALARSLYAHQLARLFEHFNRSGVLVLQYELCVRDAGRELARTYEFLGVDPAYRPAFLTRRAGRPTSGAADDLPGPVMAAALAGIHKDAEQLIGLVPDLDLELWPSLRAAAEGAVSAEN